MSPALDNPANLVFNEVNKSVAIINAAAPETGQVTLQRFRLAYAFKTAAPDDVLQQGIDAPQNFFILPLPIQYCRHASSLNLISIIQPCVPVRRGFCSQSGLHSSGRRNA
jgi:hypothetical protein